MVKKGVGLDRPLALLPAALLAMVASVHLWRSHHTALSSWREGGMGMYADINDLRGRVLHVDVRRDHWEPAVISDRLATRLVAARLEPSHAHVEALAAYLACAPLFLAENPGINDVRLTYLEQRFEAGTFTVRLEQRLRVTHVPCPLD